ncbi:MAG: heat-inducible transcription repressor HrcA [Clostridia bacterium]|nr:heat-inducible transcription repressor HrcA [Clostridia bacterium]
MKLSDRKKKILQCVVDDYIRTSQPVSSKSITEKYMPTVSSATVRSELAGLEELGYLSQLHTSSGRVPSIEAYKLYVSELMDKSKLTKKELANIRGAFEEHADNLEEVVQSTVKVISSLTDYTSLAVPVHNENDKIVKIDLFRHKKTQALLLIVSESTLIRDRFIDIPESMTDKEILEASALMQKLFVGKTLGEIKKMKNAVASEFEKYREIFAMVINAIADYIDRDKSEIIMEGEGKMLSNPEYEGENKVQNFLSVMTSKDKLRDLIAENSDDIEISIKIGDGGKELADCSIVTATYSASGVNMGTYGVIGPMHMDYQKVVSVLEGVGKILEDVLKNKKDG